MPRRTLFSIAGLLMIPSDSHAGKFGCDCAYAPRSNCAQPTRQAAPERGSRFSFFSAPPRGEIAYSVGGVMRPGSLSRFEAQAAQPESAGSQISDLENDVNRIAEIVHELARRQADDARSIDRLSRIAFENATLLRSVESRLPGAAPAAPANTGSASGSGAATGSDPTTGSDDGATSGDATSSSDGSAVLRSLRPSLRTGLLPPPSPARVPVIR